MPRTRRNTHNSLPSAGQESSSNQSSPASAMLPLEEPLVIGSVVDTSKVDGLQGKLRDLQLKIDNLRLKNEQLEALVSRPNSPVIVPQPTTVEHVFTKENIPHIKVEVSAAHPLHRNHEVESWLSNIENLTQPVTDAAFIKASRSTCRGSTYLS